MKPVTVVRYLNAYAIEREGKPDFVVADTDEPTWAAIAAIHDAHFAQQPSDEVPAPDPLPTGSAAPGLIAPRSMKDVILRDVIEEGDRISDGRPAQDPPSSSLSGGAATISPIGSRPVGRRGPNRQARRSE